MNLEIRPAKVEDIDAFAPRIPIEDQEDMINGWHDTSENMLRRSFPECEEIYTGWFDGEPVGMFGVSYDGRVFLMRAHDIDKIAIRFCRTAYKYLYRWMWKYGKITMWTHKSYNKLVRYLEWLGAKKRTLEGGYEELTFDSNDFKEVD